MFRQKKRAALLLLAVGLAGCSSAIQNGGSSASASTGAQGGSGWTDLQSLNAWRGYKSQAVPSGWTVADGVIQKAGSAEDLVSRSTYGNFELQLDWMLAEGGNAGIFYRATEEYEHIYWSGPEYQLLDDARAPDGKNPLTSAASAYGLYAPPRGVVHAANTWNSTRIVVQGNHVEHWLNGQKVVEYEFKSADWEAKVKASKFAVWPNYGRAARGYIGIQGDHNGLLQLRNIRIRELP